MSNVYDIPYVPSADDRINLMVQFAQVDANTVAADLGCGDGRVLIALAKAGARELHGFEIDPERAKLSKKNVEEAGLSDRIFIHNENFWDSDLRPFNTIVLYGITSIMARLEEKLKDELPTGSHVVSNAFTFPHWKPTKNKNAVYLYSR